MYTFKIKVKIINHSKESKKKKETFPNEWMMACCYNYLSIS